MLVGHQRIELVPRHLPRGYVVDQARKCVGERERRGGVVGDQGRGAFAANRFRRRPFLHELHEQEPPFERAELVGQLDGVRRRGLREDELILVEIAERNDARQDRAGFGFFAKDVACERAGTARRQIERRIGERQRIAGAGKSLDQRAVHQRADHSAQERRRRRNGEDSGSHAESYTARGRRAAAVSGRARYQRSFSGGHRLGCADVHPQPFEA